MDKDQYWYFTFGWNSSKRNKYVKIYGSFLGARTIMEEEFGTRWAFQYSWEEFEHQIEDYGLTELRINDER